MKNTRRLHVTHILFIALVCIAGLSYSPEVAAQSGSGNGTAIWCGTDMGTGNPPVSCPCCCSGPGGPASGGGGASGGSGLPSGNLDGGSSGGGAAGGGMCCKASPAYAKSGVYFSSATDLQVASSGWPLTASRMYSSNYFSSGLMGLGWVSNFNIKLSASEFLYAAPNTYKREVDIRLPDSRTFVFIQNENGTYAPPPGRRDTLVKNADDTWTFTIQYSRAVWHFNHVGSLTSIVDEYGNTQSWTYDGSGRVQRVTDDVSGRYLEVFFGADGRISTVRDNGNRLVQYTYDTNGYLVTVTNPLGQITTYSYTPNRFSNLLSQITDNWGRIIATMTYDATGRVHSYNEDGETYTHDYTHVADGYTIKADSLGNQWVIKYNSDGNITDRVSPDGATFHRNVSNDGLLLEEIDQVGVHTTYTYDNQGRLASMTLDATNNGPRTEYTYHPVYLDKVIAAKVKNSVTNEFDPNWQSWQYDYYGESDPAPGALHHVYRVQRDGVTLDTISEMTYDTHGWLIRRKNASGGYTENAYDSVGNIVSVSSPPNSENGARPTTIYAYDSLGRVTSIANPLGHITTTTYDALGRPLTVTQPKPTPSSNLEFTTIYSYDNWDSIHGLLFNSISDPNGKVIHQGYDSLGRLIKTFDALNGIMTNEYTRGLLISITDANGNVTGYDYDANRRPSRTTFSDSTFEYYDYYPDGRLQTKTDRKVQTIGYIFDNFKRLKQKSYPSGGTIVFNYQGHNLVSVVDSSIVPSENHTFTYDNSYRLSSDTQGVRGTISYNFTLDDRVATMSILGGPTTTYAYYPDGSLNTIEWSPVAGQFRYSYTLTGQYQMILYPNGETRSFAYDQQNRLIQIAQTHPSAGILASFTFGYDYDPVTGYADQLERRTSLITTIPSQGLTNAISTYRYDGNYQLVRAAYPNAAPFDGEVHSWTYDRIGNRVTNKVEQITQNYTYLKNGSNPLNGQRLSSDGANAYTYDANGNTLTQNGTPGSFNFGWDYNDRMTSISGSVTASYAYDYKGRRITKTVAGATTTYLYDGLNLVRSTSADKADYLFGPGIDEPLAMNMSGSISYFSVDGLGSVALLSDANGVVQSNTLYDAWGVVRSQSGTVTSDFGYTAREFAEAGLWYYRARFYRPETAVFISEDRMIRREAWDLYSYVSHRPLELIDPLGLTAVFGKKSGCGCKRQPDIDDATTSVCTNSRNNRGCSEVLAKYGLDGCFKQKCEEGIPVVCVPEGAGDCGGCGGPCNNLANTSRQIFLQPLAFSNSGICGGLQFVAGHEMAHMCGIGHDTTNTENRRKADEVGKACSDPR